MHKEKGRFLYLKLVMHDNDIQIIYLSKIVKHSTFGKVLVLLMLPFGKVSSALLLQAKAGKAGSQEQGDDPSELLWGWEYRVSSGVAGPACVKSVPSKENQAGRCTPIISSDTGRSPQV